MKPDQSVTEEELLQFAKESVGERAAAPKGIRIVEQVPLTTVGKIFKPDLLRREIADVYQQEISALDGVENVTVKERPKNFIILLLPHKKDVCANFTHHTYYAKHFSILDSYAIIVM